MTGIPPKHSEINKSSRTVNSILKITGITNIILNAQFPDGTTNEIIIHNVLIAPELGTVSLLS
jgi:hypothetical protein